MYEEFDENLLNEHDPYRSNFKSNIKVDTVIYRDGYCGRANTIAKYSEMNRLVCVRSWDEEDKKKCVFLNFHRYYRPVSKAYPLDE